MFVFDSMMIFLAITAGLLMLWKIPRVDDDMIRLPENFKLSIIIPARNEAMRISPLLASLRRQDFLAEIIVVDDHSTDATAAIAADSGAHVIHADKVENGWIGKSRACWSGAQAASGDYFLFLDADTRLTRTDSVRRIVQTFYKNGASGLLSVQPYHTVKRFYESLSAVFNIVAMSGMNVFTPLGRRLQSAGAFGPCLLCRKDEYFQTGGHEAIRGKVLDDMSLALLFRQHGLPSICYGGRGVIQFCMYPEGLAQLFEGWTKNFGSAAHLTHPIVLAMIILWIGGAFSSVSFVIRTAFFGSAPWFLLSFLCCLAYMLEMFWLARRVGNFHPLALIAYPFLHFFFVVTFLWSLFLAKVLHSVRWRGRKIEV